MTRAARPQPAFAVAMAALASVACFDITPIELPSGSGGATNTGGATTTASGGAIMASGGTSMNAGSPGNGGTANEVNIEWLALDAERAPGSLSPNAQLGIDGTFYPRSDSCVQASWSKDSRCLTGRLCNPGPDYENWGVAIEFDFDSQTSSVTGAVATRTWNPASQDARGLAWEISGTAPALQAWVLNMNSDFHGLCAADTCEISGPPDGLASVGKHDQLLFDELKKDNWGGPGVYYEFDLAAVHAVQFKIPAIVAGGNQPFSFCINRLGIVR